jgi:hemoglobin-like flavoprotein
VTPEQISQVRAVVRQLEDRPEFAARFYERLFDAAPQTRSMFSDVASQQRKLTDELSTMVAMLDDLATLEDRARDLGERHRGYGVKAGDYRLAREVMTASISDVLGDGFDAEQQAAWNRATSLISELMLSS